MIPLARFLFTPKPHASNVDALIGQKALVMEAVDPKQRRDVVKVGGENWRAVSRKRIVLRKISGSRWTESKERQSS